MYHIKNQQYWVEDVELPAELMCPEECPAPCCEARDYCAFMEPQDMLGLWINLRDYAFEYMIPISTDKVQGQIFTRGKRGKCVFRDNHMQKCRIWPIRPHVCKRFPFHNSKKPKFDCPLYDKFMVLPKNKRKKLIRLFHRRRKFTADQNLIYLEFFLLFLDWLDAYKIHGVKTKRVPIEKDKTETNKKE